MKIAALCGSPKGFESNSGELLKRLKTYFPEDIFEEISVKDDPGLNAERISGCDALIISSPLYVDGVPAQMLSLMSLIESRNIGRNIPAAVIINCGFHEGVHGKTCLQIMENWCRTAGLSWKAGICVGAGGAVSALANVRTGSGPLRRLGRAYTALHEAVNGEPMENIYLSVGIPRILYKKIVESSWRSEIRRNGLTPKDLDNRMTD